MNRTSRINENFGLKTLGILGMSLWFLIIMITRCATKKFSCFDKILYESGFFTRLFENLSCD